MPDSNLSPAAQAVVNAVDHYETNHWLTPREVAAAALRAAVQGIDYITSEEILAIADELEGIKYGTYRCNLEDKPQ